MAKKRSAPKTRQPAATVPKSFSGLLNSRAKSVQETAKAIRKIVFEELPDAEETFYGGSHAMSIYRTTAEVCWIRPLKDRCNLYFVRGAELTDELGMLEGASKNNRHVKIKSIDQLGRLPVREWLRESVALNGASLQSGISFEEVLNKLRTICLALPKTKETLTWGKPHFRVGEKIFCGCGEQQGSPRLGLKMDADESRGLMMAPGVENAPYSRPNDGWVQIDPAVFDGWDEIERLVIGSYRIIAPKRILALLDSK